MENGVYKSSIATYLVKDEKVVMILQGARGTGTFRTSKNFHDGKYVKPLTPEMEEAFEKDYDKLKTW